MGLLEHALSVAFFEWFPYVCPEPILVKCLFLYINGQRSCRERFS
eukprot:COSAG06_NODE_449_length_15623_cov_50.097204_1_plen_44_part_10